MPQSLSTFGIFDLSLGSLRTLQTNSEPEAVLLDANVSTETRKYAFAPSVVHLTRELLDALRSTVDRQPYDLRLVSDGEFAIAASPLPVGAGEWKLSLEAESCVVTQDALLLALASIVGELERACGAGGINYRSLLTQSPSQLALVAQSDA